MFAIDPEQVFELSLKDDELKPADIRPTFICRFLPYRKWLTFEKIIVDAAKESDAEKKWELWIKAATMVITNWKNVPVEYSPEALADVLTPYEIMELLDILPHRLQMDELDKKKLLWRSTSNTEDSARGVGDSAGIVQESKAELNLNASGVAAGVAQFATTESGN